MTNKKKTTEPAEGGLSFEKALERLEKIVEQMESAELPLDEVLKRYEEGTELVRYCSVKLEEAEKKVEILSKKKDGAPQLKKFQAEEETEDRPAASPEESEQEGKLL